MFFNSVFDTDVHELCKAEKVFFHNSFQAYVMFSSPLSCSYIQCIDAI